MAPRFAALTLLLIALLAGRAETASATFPGANGLLAVEPAHGGGVLLVGADGRRAHRICAGLTGCPRVLHPAWSPDGRLLAVRRGAHGLDLLYPDGSCYRCLRAGFLYRAGLSSGVEGPAWSPAGRLLLGGIYEREVLVSIDPDGVTFSRRRVHPTAAPAGSATGKILAVGRDRAGFSRLYEISGRRPRALVRGGQPSWSPDGRSLAYVRAGSVYVVRLGSRRPRLLARRAHAPVWSPDGRSVAYVAGSRGVGPVMRVRTDGGGGRALGVRGSRLDWQVRRVRRRETCQRPRGDDVTADGVPGGTAFQAFGGASESLLVCFVGDEMLRQLDLIPIDGYGYDYYGPVAFARPLVAYVDTYSNRVGDATSLVVQDARRGRVLTREYDFPLGGGFLVDRLVVNRHGDAGWRSGPLPSVPGRRPSPDTDQRIGVRDRAGDSRILDRGPAGSLDDLRISAHSVTWTHDGEPRVEELR